MNDALDESEERLTNAQQHVANAVSNNQNELEGILLERFPSSVPYGDAMGRREGIREILESLKEWKKASNDFLAALSQFEHRTRTAQEGR
jgi:hypothetical protein